MENLKKKDERVGSAAHRASCASLVGLVLLLAPAILSASLPHTTEAGIPVPRGKPPARLEELLSLCRDESPLVCANTISKTLAHWDYHPEFEIPQELFLHFFEKHQALERREPTAHVPLLEEWKLVFDLFRRQHPRAEAISALTLNLAGYLTDEEQLDSALSIYQQMNSRFDGSTRFGAESRFFAGQILYRQERYAEAAEQFSRIGSTVFLPVDRPALEHRQTECAFRLAERALTSGDTTTALIMLDSISHRHPRRPLSDSVRFFSSHIHLLSGDTARAFSVLDSMVRQSPADSLHLGAVYNHQWLLCDTRYASIAFPIDAGLAFLKSGQPDSLKSSHNRHMLLQVLLQGEPATMRLYVDRVLPRLSPKEQEQSWKDILRTAASPEMRETALRLLAKDIGRNPQAWPWPAEAWLALYRDFHAYNSGAGLSGRHPDFDSPWENHLARFLRGAAMVARSIEKDAFSPTSIDSVLATFQPLGQENSELAFLAAWESSRFYAALASRHARDSTNGFTKPGHRLVEIEFLSKALMLGEKVGNWRRGLDSLLHPETLAGLHRLAVQREALETRWKEAWKELSMELAILEPEKPSLKGLLAMEDLQERVTQAARRYALEPVPPTKARIVSAFWLWHQSLDSEDTLQAEELRGRLSEGLLTLLLDLEDSGDSLTQAWIGWELREFIRYPDLDKCFWSWDADAKMPSRCLPLVDQAPTPRAFLASSGETLNAVNRSGHLRRAGILHFQVLCESHRIRHLKSKLRELDG